MIILEVIQMLLLSWSFVVLCEMSHYNVSVVLVQFFVRLVFVYVKNNNNPPPPRKNKQKQAHLNCMYHYNQLVLTQNALPSFDWIY